MATNYGRKLGFWEALLTVLPALALIWALSNGYGPRLFFWGAGAVVAYFGLKVVRLIYLAYFK
jgi:hypothetical protein